MENTLISDGCILTQASLSRCVIGLRSVIREGTRLENVLMFGADYFDGILSSPQEKNKMQSQIPLGIGKNCVIKNAIIDKDARIGDNVYLSPEGKLCGDVDYERVAPIVHAISPVPGGVGAVTTSVLAKNLVKAVILQS